MGRTITSDLMDGRMQHSIHDLSKLCRRGELDRQWWLTVVSRLITDSLMACFRILSQQQHGIMFTS